MNLEEYDMDILREDLIKEFGNWKRLLDYYWNLDYTMAGMEPSDYDYLLIAIQLGINLEKYRRMII